MISMKEHLRLKKIQFLYEVKNALQSDFNIGINLGTGFTKSDFFHFVPFEGKKYVYKEAMRFILTNADTYYLHRPLSSEYEMNPDQEERSSIDNSIDKMFNFFRHDINDFKLYPEFIEETDNFFVFKYYDEDWEKITSLTWKDSRYISKHFIWSYKKSQETVTPFFNNMPHKLMKNIKTGQIKMIDLKSLEFHSVSNLAIYMYSNIMNDLYLLDWRFISKEKLIEPFKMDYPAEASRIIKHYVW